MVKRKNELKELLEFAERLKELADMRLLDTPHA